MENWLKLLHSFPRSPKLRALCRELRVSHHAAMGLAVQWLLWVDEQSAEGETTLTPDEMDAELDKKGATSALCAIGWARVDEYGLVHAVDFGKHCGESAKKRAQTARRVGAHRRRCNAKSVTPVTPAALAEQEEEYIEGVEVYTEEEVTAPADPPPPPPTEAMPPSAPRCPAGSAPPPPTAVSFPEECRDWARAIVDTVPEFARLRTIPKDARDSILAAWRSLPSAAEPDALEALRTFYAADDAAIDAAKLWRPEKLRSFFMGLHDVLANAERFTRRQRAAAKAEAKVAAAKAAKAEAKAAAAAKLAAAEAEFETQEDRLAYFRNITTTTTNE